MTADRQVCRSCPTTKYNPSPRLKLGCLIEFNLEVNKSVAGDPVLKQFSFFGKVRWMPVFEGRLTIISKSS